MKIIPGVGIDMVQFGMSQRQCETILGPPDHIIEKKEDMERILEFHDARLKLTFYLSEEGKLGYIRTANTSLEYNGIQLIDTNIATAKSKIFGGIIKEWEKEEYDHFSSYFNEKYWLTLNVNFGDITDIELGVLFKNDDEFDWPV